MNERLVQIPTTESEEMYLITVARTAEDGHVGPIPVASIASSLGVSVASANEMVRKLAGRGFVAYEPYHGVELTGSGNVVAERVLRTRRLWATFLADHLGFSPSDADEQACDLEHVTTAEAADRLAEFLGDPESGPLGKPIPRADVPSQRPRAARLGDAAMGSRHEVVSIAAPDAARAFLQAEGIAPGSLIQLVATGTSGLLVEVDGTTVHVAHAVADTIEVRQLPPEGTSAAR